MKSKQEMETTDNSNVFRKAEKEQRADTGEIHCSYCPYNRGENSKRNKGRKKRTWKDFK